MKLSGSSKFILSVLGLFLVAWLGWKGYAAFRLRGVVLDPIKPGRVNVIAVSPAAGYRIIVANQIAYLAKLEGDEDGAAFSSGNDSVANASRLPLRELIETLQGKEDAIGPLVMRLNEMPDTDTALHTKVWKKEDIDKALAGDQAMRDALEKDLNVTLEGRPISQINLDAIMEGILIESPVSLTVNVAGEERLLTGRIREAYQPNFCASVADKVNERFNPSQAVIAGIYQELAQAMMDSGGGENVRQSLMTRTADDRLNGLAEPLEKVLQNTVVLLNEGHVTSATFETYDVGQNRKSNDISLGLTEEGRMRLWKYSHDHSGFQLLFVVDSIAIAAPRIETVLNESVTTIRRVPSTDLVQEAVALLNEAIKDKK